MFIHIIKWNYVCYTYCSALFSKSYFWDLPIDKSLVNIHDSYDPYLSILSLTEILGCFYFSVLAEQQWTSCARDSPSRSPEMNLLRTLNFINCCKIALWNDCSNLYCHQQCIQFGAPPGLGVWHPEKAKLSEASWSSLWGGSRRGAENDGCKKISLHIQNVSTKDVQVLTMKQVWATITSSMGSSYSLCKKLWWKDTQTSAQRTGKCHQIPRDWIKSIAFALPKEWKMSIVPWWWGW